MCMYWLCKYFVYLLWIDPFLPIASGLDYLCLCVSLLSDSISASYQDGLLTSIWLLIKCWGCVTRPTNWRVRMFRVGSLLCPLESSLISIKDWKSISCTYTPLVPSLWVFFPLLLAILTPCQFLLESFVAGIGLSDSPQTWSSLLRRHRCCDTVV